MPYARIAPALAALAVLALAPTVQASFPAGVWARVDQVTTGKDPSQIRIDGIFMVANQKPDFPQYTGYSVPQYGYMFYDCGDKQLDTCVMEWNELSAVAGTDDRCRGWGDSSLPDNGSVRPTDAPQAEPDTYPISMGVLVGFSPCEALDAWALENPPLPDEPGTDTDPSTTDVSSTTDAPQTSGDPASTGGPLTTGEPLTTGDDSSGAPATSDAPATDGDPATGGPTEADGSTGNNTTEPGATATDSGELDDDKGGCSCDATDRPDPAAALLLLAGLGLVRRRRRSA